MRKLINEEIHHIGGGTQYLSITSKVEFDGIPENCVADFFNANKENAANFNLDTLGHDIIKQCAAFNSVLSYSYSTDLIPLTMSLIEI